VPKRTYIKITNANNIGDMRVESQRRESSVTLRTLTESANDTFLCGWRNLANTIKNSAVSLACEKDLTVPAKVRHFAPPKIVPQNKTGVIN